MVPSAKATLVSISEARKANKTAADNLFPSLDMVQFLLVRYFELMIIVGI
jgi:hypothetical protein